MSNALRTLAVAAVMAGVAPMASHAAVVADQLSLSFTTGTWQPGAISVIQDGVTVSNAKLSLDPSGSRLALVNTSDAPIVITIDTDLFHLNALSLDYFAGFSVGISINNSTGQALTGSGGSWELTTELQRICPGGSQTCNPDVLVDGAGEWISTIAFSPDASNPLGVDVIGLNGLNFTQIDTTGGNNGGGGTVPEPAGYGLAALALLAAGAASRRRNAR